MRRLTAALVAIYSLSLLSASSSAALSTMPSDGVVVRTESPLIIIQYSFTNSRVDYVQVFNNGDTVFDLAGWKISYLTSDNQVIHLSTLDGLIEPRKYVVVSDSRLKLNSPFEYTLATGDDTGIVVSQVQLLAPEGGAYLDNFVQPPPQTVANRCNRDAPPNTVNPTIRRTTSPSTGNYLSSFCYLPADSTEPLYMDNLYTPHTDTVIQITELLPRARQCAPLEVAASCREYVKLYNPSANDIQLDGLRLRIGYQGQVPSTSNAVPLTGTIPAGHYALITSQPDGDPLSLTNTGGWVWLEDVYGYGGPIRSTIVSYESAGSSSRIGWAWMYDDTDGQWKWTTQPMPYNQPSRYVMTQAGRGSVRSTNLISCRSDQYRNPLTNRCKLKSPSSSSLAPCKPGQYRSPATNRCRSTSTSVSSLTPCKPGQVRNPETNRCKSAASMASSLKSCAPNQERNPLTNRCRNKIGTAVADFPVQAVANTGEATVGWWAFGGVGAIAAGYAGWEWRREMLHAIQKSVTFFTSSK